MQAAHSLTPATSMATGLLQMNDGTAKWLIKWMIRKGAW